MATLNIPIRDCGFVKNAVSAAGVCSSHLYSASVTRTVDGSYTIDLPESIIEYAGMVDRFFAEYGDEQISPIVKAAIEYLGHPVSLMSFLIFEDILSEKAFFELLEMCDNPNRLKTPFLDWVVFDVPGFNVSLKLSSLPKPRLGRVKCGCFRV